MKRFLIPITFVLLIAALAVSLFINRQLYGLANTYYRQLNAVRLDPVGLQAYYSEDATTSPDEKLVVFFGDSRAYQWPAIELDSHRFLNRGIGTQTSAQVLARYDVHVAPLNPQIVILQVGVNDLKTIPLFPERRDKIVGDLQNNIAEIVAKSRQQEASVLITTIFPIGTVPLERRMVWSDAVAAAIVDVNEYIRSLESDGVSIFDTVPILAAEDGKVRAEYEHDLLHLNAAGYAALNQALAHTIIATD